ncbi:hypothetical protein BZG35_05640 [Brevundimonas sp. LM2]|uniref:glycosyltransferase n=1 Tax=Brevundimonas sp. LM2 TaxID=1938605 RepID=UPI000983BAEB|nr:glycosyltransferase [Brevundimonas sp. LM2]AQR61190.1 hypothetical protein BZG35_05640 [Brevundimonas sp. LM2]
MVTALSTLAMLFGMLAIHPFVTYPLSLLAFARRAPATRDLGGGPPSVAICVSAYNEEAVILDKVNSLIAMAAHYGNATIHIYVDGASDRTVEILKPFQDRIDLVVGTERLGKTAGMNLLVQRSESQFLVFTDANVVTPIDSISKLVNEFKDQAVGAVSARLRYVNAEESITSNSGAGYWKMQEAVKKIEARTIGVIGVDGAMFMIERSLYRPAPAHLIDDLFISLQLMMQRRVVVSANDLWVEERSATALGDEMRRKSRIACQAINVHRAIWPELKRAPIGPLYGYLSHRLLKWLLPYSLAIAALLALVALTLTFGQIVPVLAIAGVCLSALAALLGFKPARFIWISAGLLYAVAIGVAQGFLSRMTYTTWSPAGSIRASASTGPAETGSGR